MDSQKQAQTQHDALTEPYTIDALMERGRAGQHIVGARERHYARVAELETQPVNVLEREHERVGSWGDKWKEGDRDTDERWWMQEDQDDLPTTEPGEDEEDVPFCTDPIEDEVIPSHLARFFLEREGNDAAGGVRNEGTSAADSNCATYFFGIGLDAGIAHRGTPNEDSVFATTGVRITNAEPEPAGLFIVADGLGGHTQGREASHLAVRAASDAILPALLHENSGTGEDEEDFLRDLIQEGVHRANFALYQQNCEESISMGTTFTAVLLVGKKAYIVNVGDSRVYLYRRSEGLRQLTRDHSLVMRLVEVGAIAREDIYVHPLRNQVYRSLGNAAEIEVEAMVMDVEYGDLLLLCSDGLWEMVRDQEIDAIVSRPLKPAQLSTELVECALRNGGDDNIGIVVVGVARSM